MTLRAPFPIEPTRPDPRVPRAPRFRLAGLTAVVDLGDRFWAGRVVNLSATGCLIRSEEPLQLGGRVNLVPSHPGDTHLPLELPARVVRVTEAGASEVLLGLEFGALSGRDREALYAFAAGHGRPLRPH